MTSKELYEKVRGAGSVEEVRKIAEENGVKLDDNAAREAFDKYCGKKELSDDELDAANGGCRKGPSVVCTVCGGEMELVQFHVYDRYNDVYYSVYECTACGHVYEG